MAGEDTVFTIGLWTVRDGRQAEFVDAWRSFAQWTVEHHPGSLEGFLTKDNDSLVRFVSFSPWADLESVREYRNSAELKEFLEKAKELCTDIQPMIVETVAHIEKNRVISCVVERKD